MKFMTCIEPIPATHTQHNTRVSGGSVVQVGYTSVSGGSVLQVGYTWRSLKEKEWISTWR